MLFFFGVLVARSWHFTHPPPPPDGEGGRKKTPGLEFLYFGAELTGSDMFWFCRV